MNKLYVAGFFNILGNFLLYNYLERFETIHCNCSLTVKQNISKMMLMSFYVITIGKIMFPDIPKSARFAIMLYTLIFDVVFITYIFELKSKNCVCEDKVQNFTTSLIYYKYILVTMIVIVSLISIVFINLVK